MNSTTIMWWYFDKTTMLKNKNKLQIKRKLQLFCSHFSKTLSNLEASFFHIWYEGYRSGKKCNIESKLTLTEICKKCYLGKRGWNFFLQNAVLIDWIIKIIRLYTQHNHTCNNLLFRKSRVNLPMALISLSNPHGGANLNLSVSPRM